MSHWRSLLARFRAAPSEVAVMAVVFLATGLLMNSFGKWAHLAEFKNWWQVLTCYWGYVLPLALFIRGYSKPLQYAICVTAFIPLEVVGYGLGTSIAHDGNAFEAVAGVRNFTAVMVAGVGLIPPIGLWISQRIHGAIAGSASSSPGSAPAP